jgi:hypothetical protein
MKSNEFDLRKKEVKAPRTRVDKVKSLRKNKRKGKFHGRRTSDTSAELQSTSGEAMADELPHASTEEVSVEDELPHTTEEVSVMQKKIG